jgi:hypothetical protein
MMPVTNIIEFPRRRQFAIIVEPERGGEGFLVLRGSHGWLYGSMWQAVADAQHLASADSVAVVVQP